MTRYTLLSQGLSTLTKDLTDSTRVKQISSNEFSTPISDSVKCKQTKVRYKIR